MYEKIKNWYDKGIWTAEMVHKAVDKGIITEAQYLEICGGAEDGSVKA